MEIVALVFASVSGFTKYLRNRGLQIRLLPGAISARFDNGAHLDSTFGLFSGKPISEVTKS